jgi:hypothetical protein
VRVRRPSPAMIVALVALVIALGGTAVAASHYIITSTSQIKPSVLHELRDGQAVSAAVPKGPKAVIDRIDLAAPVTTTTTSPEGPFEATAVPLANATWTQAAHQANVLIGQVTFAKPPLGQCAVGAGSAFTAAFELVLDGRRAAFSETYPLFNSSEQVTPTYQLAWKPDFSYLDWNSASLWLVDGESAVPHTLSARAFDRCPDGAHFTIKSLQVDVLGFR